MSEICEDEHIPVCYNKKDVVLCIFDNQHGILDPFMNTISFLFMLPDERGDVGGVVYSNNPDLGTFQHWHCKSRRALNVVYYTSKGKILGKEGVSLGFEGHILNISGNS